MSAAWFITLSLVWTGGLAGLAQLLTKNAGLRGGEFFEALTWDLDRFADGQAMPDDISSVVLDYRGRAPDKKSAKKT